MITRDLVRAEISIGGEGHGRQMTRSESNLVEKGHPEVWTEVKVALKKSRQKILGEIEEITTTEAVKVKTGDETTALEAEQRSNKKMETKRRRSTSRGQISKCPVN